MPNFIFYSWQSDLPNATNRGLIERALEQAAKAIRSDPELIVDPVIDRDTADVPGAPDIGATILDKIDRSSVFVADVSIINRNSRFRSSPNPNVLIELGYTLKALGGHRVVLVANTYFGPPDELPFDLRQKRVITYHSAPSDTSRKDGRGQLALELERAIRSILAMHDLRRGHETLDPASFRLDQDQRFKRHRESSLTNFPMKGDLGLFTLVTVPLSRTSIPEQRFRETFLDTGRTYSEFLNYSKVSPEVHSDGYTRRSRARLERSLGDRGAAVTCYQDGYIITEGYIDAPSDTIPSLKPAWLVYEIQRHLQLSKEVLADLQREILLVIRLEDIAKIGWEIYVTNFHVDSYMPYVGYHNDIVVLVNLSDVGGRDQWDIVCTPARAVLGHVARIFGMVNVPQDYWTVDGKLQYAIGRR